MQVVFYTHSSGRSPITDFIDKQSRIDQAIISAVLEDIEDSGFTAKGCKFRQLKGKLWEIKIKTPSGSSRFLYLMTSKEKMIILHGFKKKSQKTPLKEIHIGLKRLKEYL